MIRVAACISGEMRNRPDALASIKASILDPLTESGAKIDIIINTRKDSWWTTASTLPFRIFHVETNVPQDASDIISAHNPLRSGQYDHPDAKGSSTANRRAFLYQSYLQYYASLKTVAELKRRAEEQDGVKYDWVMRLRPDILFQGVLNPAKLEPGHIYFPENDRWPFHQMTTLSDKFAIGSSEHMDNYFNRRIFLREWCSSHEIHAEALDGLKVVVPDDLYHYSWRPDRDHE